MCSVSNEYEVRSAQEEIIPSLYIELTRERFGWEIQDRIMLKLKRGQDAKLTPFAKREPRRVPK